jgi:hypothetical protein
MTALDLSLVSVDAASRLLGSKLIQFTLQLDHVLPAGLAQRVISPLRALRLVAEQPGGSVAVPIGFAFVAASVGLVAAAAAIAPAG